MKGRRGGRGEKGNERGGFVPAQQEEECGNSIGGDLQFPHQKVIEERDYGLDEYIVNPRNELRSNNSKEMFVPYSKNIGPFDIC